MNDCTQALQIMTKKFSCDTLLSLATTVDNRPFVRTVNSYYENGAFYVVTYTLSNKMQQIENNPDIAVCGEWFTAHGIGENLGHVRAEKNTPIMAKLRKAFATWYNNGHVNEEDPHTCVLRIQLTDGVLLHDEKKYEIDFIKSLA